MSIDILGWGKVNLSDKKYFKIIGSGVNYFKGTKNYYSTSSVDGNKVLNPEGEFTYFNRPSRANMQPSNNTVWFAKMKNTLKVVRCSERLVANSILSTGFSGIFSDKVHAEYLEQIFLSEDFNIQKDNLSEGSTQQAINNSKLKDIYINIPLNVNEQKKIAEILTKVDEAIENTEQLIQKYEQVKVGLMQDLLTKGIDVNGNIRSEETHQFKDSPLGRIPVEWEVVELNSFYASPIRDFGSFSSTKLIEFLDSGVPFIKSEMVERFFLNWNAITYISEDVHKLLNKSYVKKGNILFSKIGSALGKAVVFEEDYQLCNSNAAVAKIDINEKLASNDFITFYLNSVYAQRQFEEMIVSLLPRINLKDINRLLVPKIPLNEQNTIVSILKCILNKNNENKKLLDKLKQQKKGLMQDLLSRKVCVNY